MLINSLPGAYSKQAITPGQLQLVLIPLAAPYCAARHCYADGRQ